MNFSEQILSRSRFFWFLGISFTVIGIFSWFTIPKEEDPRLKPRFGYVKLIYPGASVFQLKKYVVQETEKELASVDAIAKISTTIRSGFAGLRIEFKAGIQDDSEITRYWDEVEDALARAYKVFPQGAFPPSLDRKLEQEAILISVDASDTIRHEVLLDLENEILKNPRVSRINRIGDEGRQISIQVDEKKLSKSGINSLQLLGQIQIANTQTVSGYIENDNERVNIQSTNAFDRIEELKNFLIITTSGNSIPLSKLALVTSEEKRPASEEMRWNGRKVYGLGIISKKGIDLRLLGDSIEKIFPSIISKYPESESVKIEIINSQPDYVKKRLVELSFSLLSSIGLLSVFMIFFMGVRVGLLVSVMFPIISLISLGIYSLSGGILHQIAIAAFVLSFGILIDNIVVIVESIQEKLDQGLSKSQAGIETISEFTSPLFSSTLTTIASFLPMALAKDTSSEFTSAIPKIVIISLIISYIASIVLSPSLALNFLIARKTQKKTDYLELIGNRIADIVILKPKLLTLSLIAFFLLVLMGIPFLKFKFFPSADRNQLILEFAFPEGTSYKKTLDSVLEFEKELSQTNLKGYASFIGRSTSFFYYNLPQRPNAPALSQILLVSKEDSFPEQLKNEIFLKAKKMGARVRIKTLEQGPPVDASIVLRVYHSDRELWKKKVLELAEMVLKMKGVELAWTDSSGEQKKITFDVSDKSLIEKGSNRRDVSLALLKTTYGLNAGFFKTGKESVPIILTSLEKEKSSLQNLNMTLVGQNPDREILAKDISSPKEEFSEAVHHLYNRKSYVNLLVDLEKNQSPKEVLKFIKEYLSSQGLKEKEDYEFDGEQGQSAESNNALFQTLPVGITILLATLIWEFNSFKLLLLILTCVPTSFLGMIPGLAISGQPFGFLPLLALFALIGIAVNNGIILIDKFQISLNDGSSLEEAVRKGLSQRLRPILLTSGSTIIGMIPLGFSSSTLWPPFAWAMVSGLFISTVTTLFIIPRLFLWKGGKKQIVNKSILALVIYLLPICIYSESATRKVISLEEAMELSKDSNLARANFHEATKISLINKEAKQATYYPKVGVYGERVSRDKNLYLETPIGASRFGNREFNQTGMEIYQTIWSAKNSEYLIPATELFSEAANKKNLWENKNIAFQTANTYIDCVGLRIKKEIISKKLETIKLLLKESRRLLSIGKLREIDVLKVERGVSDLERAEVELTNYQETCSIELTRLVNKEETVEVDVSSVPKISSDSSVGHKREDLDALRLKIEANKKELGGINAENYPEVYAKGNLIYSDQANLNPFTYSQVAVGARWTIFDGGVRKVKYEQKLLDIKNLEELYIDAEKRIQVSISDWTNKEQSKIQNLSLLEKEIKLVEKKMREEESRFLSGRNSSSFFLQMKDMYLDVLEKKSLLEWELVRSRLGKNFSKGHILLSKEDK
ncbi:MAG: efflux RND transporter permease subunit [Leptospiraceae bacterium]|nr:efflux RND transporter permease subunit [Leptospiraceae bacterium]